MKVPKRHRPYSFGALQAPERTIRREAHYSLKADVARLPVEVLARRYLTRADFDTVLGEKREAPDAGTKGGSRI